MVFIICDGVALLYSDLDIPNIIVELLNAASYAGLNSVSRTDCIFASSAALSVLYP